ncbi:sel1 repeat family protein [Synechococcus sp. MU1644]|nr:sel1 repeat family protein [Synechococcus sp. MU1644]
MEKDLVLNPSEGILTNDESTWRLVEKTGAYEAYIELFPEGAYLAQAERGIEARGPWTPQSEENVWKKLTLDDWSYKPSNLLLDATLAGTTVQAIAAAAVVGDPGDADAKYLLASLFFNGHEEVGVDYAIAFSFYRAACLSGHMRSCAALGNAYDQGLGVGENDENAAMYARRACENGVARGCTNLGYHYRRGEGVEEDLWRALELYETSCRQQDPLGCTNAGFLAYSGTDRIAADKVKAARLWELGCTGGDMLGCTNFGWALSTGEGVGSNPDPVRGLDFHRVACAGGNAQACERVGRALRDGMIVSQDVNEARLAFQRACMLGRTSSCSIDSDSEANE